MKYVGVVVLVSCILFTLAEARSELKRQCRKRSCLGSPAAADCKRVKVSRPNGVDCEPVCRLCLDKVNRKNLSCPPKSEEWYGNEQSKPKCRKDKHCAADEKCCSWKGRRRCYKAIDKARKQGTCPIIDVQHISMTNCKNITHECKFDVECTGDLKCCESYDCSFRKCQNATEPSQLPIVPKRCKNRQCSKGTPVGPDCKKVKKYRPNGNGCEPVCIICKDASQKTSRENLACPTSPYFFPTKRTEPKCKRNRECADDERCCFWSGIKHCLKGIDKTPKPGSCPPSMLLQSDKTTEGPFLPELGCKADYGGCIYDSECKEDKKCCKTEGCYYSECQKVEL